MNVLLATEDVKSIAVTQSVVLNAAAILDSNWTAMDSIALVSYLKLLNAFISRVNILCFTPSLPLPPSLPSSPSLPPSLLQISMSVLTLQSAMRMPRVTTLLEASLVPAMQATQEMDSTAQVILQLVYEHTTNCRLKK